MKTDLEQALDFVMRWEGGYTRDPHDPGGETKWGISRRAYPNLDIKGLTRDEAAGIYRRDYWDRAGCAGLPSPLDLVVFDTAVNTGVERALEFLSRTRCWKAYIIERIDYYNRLDNRRYLHGWINRTVDLYRTALDMEQAYPLSKASSK